MQSTTKYMFIDAGYLRKVFEAASLTFFDGTALPIDYKAISRGFTKCFYYDCPIPATKDETEAAYKIRAAPQIEFFRDLRMIEGWHVFEGKTAGRGSSARQKKIDVQIAVDMLTHSHRRNTDQIDFIAGDADFAPLIDALVKDGMFVRVWYEKRSASEDLLMAADARVHLDIFHLFNFVLQDFRKTHPIPVMSIQAKAVEGAVLIATGTGKERDIELRKTDGGLYQITHIDAHNPGSHLHMYHADQKMLKLCYGSRFGDVHWTDVI